MYKENSVCVVIPAYNEGTQIAMVVESMPEYVDAMAVVDDLSTDDTVERVKSLQNTFSNLYLIEHPKNRGVGAAIASGYVWARDHDYDVAVVMAGDGQMDPEDLPAILDPVVEGHADYSKGNRLFTGEAFKNIPKVRYFGNSMLSLLTKIASGYWNIADSQSGYTAINKKALQTINWQKMYKSYGQPNDLLVMLNVYNFRVRDVEINPIYGVGEKSGIKIRKVLFSISYLLLKRFLWRMKEKYIIRDFHPLVFFYFFGTIIGFLSVVLFARVFYIWLVLGHDIPQVNALAAMFSFMSATQFILFAMWFDMEANKDLK